MRENKRIEDEIRRKIVKKYEDGKGPQSIADELELNVNSVSSIINIFKKTGRVEKLKTREKAGSKITAEASTLIDSLINSDVSITLKELKVRIRERLQINVSESLLCRKLKTMNYSLKRVSFVPESRNSEETINLREVYCNNFSIMDDNKIIFVDEFGISCSSRTCYGRSMVGSPARKQIRSIRSKNVSVCAALMKSGLVYFKISNSSFNSTKFSEFLRDLVGIVKRSGVLNGIIIMDNASIHKSEEQRVFLNSEGFERLFLPAYSPQLNPIEELFSKWKNIISRRNPNNVEELYSFINESHSLITPEDCQGFWNHVRIFVLKGIRREEF